MSEDQKLAWLRYELGIQQQSGNESLVKIINEIIFDVEVMNSLNAALKPRNP